MIGFLKKLFSKAPEVDYGQLLAQGGTIVDVRTRGEYSGGHIKGSVNIPLNELQAGMGKLKKDKPIITVCASGMRSGAARSALASAGFTQVYNGGSWFNLKKYEK
jgi:rhodanese-related sulfurtransferase